MSYTDCYEQIKTLTNLSTLDLGLLLRPVHQEDIMRELLNIGLMLAEISAVEGEPEIAKSWLTTTNPVLGLDPYTYILRADHIMEGLEKVSTLVEDYLKVMKPDTKQLAIKARRYKICKENVQRLNKKEAA